MDALDDPFRGIGFISQAPSCVKLIGLLDKWGSEVAMRLEGFTRTTREDAERYGRLGCWLGITFGDMFDRGVDLYPDKEALVDERSRLTYAQLREKADRLAIGFMNVGIKRHDRVLLQLPNWSEFVYSYFALQKIGAIVVLVLPRHRLLEINLLCRSTGAVAWVLPERYRNFNNLAMIDDVRHSNPLMKHIILVRGGKRGGFHNLERLIEETKLREDSLSELAARRPDPTEIAHLGPTGGTTGLPKLAARTHNDHICNAEYKRRAWELNRSETCVAMAPVTHDLTFTVAVCGAMLTSAKLVLVDSSRPEDFCESVQRERATCAVTVPAVARRIVNLERLKDYDLTSLLKLHVAGGPSPSDLIRGIHEKIGCNYVIGLGSTEGLNCMTRLDYDLNTICNTSGRPCCPFSEYKTIDQDERAVPPQMVGELVIKGPDVFAGYFRSPEENRKSFTQDGFFKTGDLAIIENSGDIKIMGRIKDVILRGGENIFPGEIERFINNHPDIEAVAVIGMPDKELGERVCAYIKPAAGSKLSFNGIVSFLKSGGASVLQLPERIEFIDRIPLTKVGKVDKRALQQDLKRRLQSG